MSEQRKTWIRCMGGGFCTHAQGTCTASTAYQAQFKTPEVFPKSHVGETLSKLYVIVPIDESLLGLIEPSENPDRIEPIGVKVTDHPAQPGAQDGCTSIRDAVYDAIDGERDYQVQRWGETLHTPTEWALYIANYSTELNGILTRYAGPEAHRIAMHTVRKIAAMSVCCMEQNGVYPREGITA